MNSFELNKILGALLACCLVLLGLNITAGAVFAPAKPAKPGFDIAVKEPEAGKGAAGPAEPSQPIETLLASASIEKGQATAKQCGACHTFEKGGPNRVGPNLWGIVDEERGKGRGNFNFSAAMKAKGGKWTIQELNTFIQNPKAAIPGTNMTFAGISRDSTRADVLAFLNSLADSPKPLPKAAAAPAPSAGASPGGGAPAATPQPGNSGAQPNARPGQAPPPK